jgi:hypothetical protein
MSNQLSGRPVNVDASKVVKLISLEVQDNRTPNDPDMHAATVEDLSVHGIPISVSPSAHGVLAVSQRFAERLFASEISRSHQAR